MESQEVDIKNKFGFVNLLGWYNGNSTITERSNYLRKDYPTNIIPGSLYKLGVQSAPHNFYFSVGSIDNLTKYEENTSISEIELEAIISTFKCEEYDDEGNETMFYIKVKSFFEKYKIAALNDLINLIKSGKLDSKTLSVILAILGDINEKSIISLRRKYLESFLFNENSLIRYGAIIGLSNMNMKLSLISLKKALKNEDNPTLLNYLKTTIKELSSLI